MTTLAAIDVGSNAIRLLIRRYDSVGCDRGHWYKRYALRLGGDVFAAGQISAEKISAMEEIFRDMAARLEKRRVDGYRAVATSAMRDAQNGSAIAKRLRLATGINLEIISGDEELAISHRSLLRSLGTVDPSTLIVDLGGGSLEVDRAARQGGLSLPLGTVRLLDRYPELAERVSDETLARARRGMKQTIGELLGSQQPAPLAVGTGGNFDALARLLPASGGAMPSIQLAGLPALCSEAAALSQDERMRRFHLRPDRVDLLLPAFLVIQGLVEHFGIERFAVPGAGLREGLVDELSEAPRMEEAVLRAYGQLGAARTALHPSTQAALRLFTLLAPLHGLWPSAQNALIAAGELPYLAALDTRPKGSATPRALLRRFADWPLDGPGRRTALYALGDESSSEPAPPRISERHRKAAELIGALLAVCASSEDTPEALRVDLLNEPLTITLPAGQAPAPRAHARLEGSLGRPVRLTS